MPSLSWRPSPFGMPRSVAHRRSNAAPTSSRSFISNITWCSTCGSSNGARARATVWWRALQWKKRTSSVMPGRELHLEPVRLLEARGRRSGTRPTRRTPSWRTRRGRSPTPSVRKPPGTSADENGVGASAGVEDDLDRRCPTAPSSRARRPTRRSPACVGVLDDVEPRSPGAAPTVASNASASTASKPTATASLAGPACDDEPVGPVVVAPGARARRGRLAGDEADHVGEDRGEAVGLGHLEHEVAELESMLHGRSSRVGRCGEGGEEPLGVGPERVGASRRSPPRRAARAATAAANSGVKG